MANYNVDLKSSRTQASIGRKAVEVYKETEGYSNLLLATVVGVNFIYNSVEVVTVRNNENIVKPKSTMGRYSARLPVGYGGSWANGNTYGQTVPISIGDTVLIGFINSNLDSPVVINIYKDDVVSKELASTGKITGNPEDGEIYNEAMAVTNVYPSQTMDKVWGDGNILQTFVGRAFLATSTSAISSNPLDDTDTDYENLGGVMKPNGELRTPVSDAVGRMLYTHYTKGITSNKTTSFFDELGNYRLSRVLRDTDKRSYLELTKDGDMYLRHRPTTFEVYDTRFIDEEEASRPQSTLDSYIGIVKGVPTIHYKGFTLTVDKGDLLLNGKAISTIFDEYTEDLEVVVEKLTVDVNAIVEELSTVNLEDIISLRSDLDSLVGRVSINESNISSLNSAHIALTNEVSNFINVIYKNKMNSLDSVIVSHGTSIDLIANELDGARGTSFDKVGDRLASMDSTGAVTRSMIVEFKESIFFDNQPLENGTSVSFEFPKPYKKKPSVIVGVSNAVNQLSQPEVYVNNLGTDLEPLYSMVTVILDADSADISIQAMGLV